MLRRSMLRLTPLLLVLLAIAGAWVIWRRHVAAEQYRSPVDGATYTAHWTTTRPKSPAPRDPAAPAHLVNVVLLTSEQETAARLSAHELSEYIKSLGRAVSETFASAERGPGNDLALQVELIPGQPSKIRVASRSSMPEGLGDAMYRRLRDVAPPRTRGPIKFDAYYAIWGGSGQALPSERE